MQSLSVGLPSRSRLALAAVAGLALCSPALAQKSEAEFVLNPSIAREGTGDARLAMNASELKPLAAKWSDLTEWTGGSALTADATKDKPVLIVTWTAWAPASQNLIKRVAKLAADNKDLVVVAVHTKDRYELATKWLTDNGMKILAARDGNGAFRKALMSDQDPDVYLIDRSGSLRYADIESESLEAAVAELVGETKEVALSQPSERTRQYKNWLTERAKTSVVGTSIRPGERRKVEFEKPDAGLYEKALWVEKNKSENIQGATDIQGQSLPFGFDGVTWFNAEGNTKPNTDGKVTVVDFWATWCGPCKRSMPLIEEMQKTFRDDLVVIGITGLSERRVDVQRWMNANKTDYVHCFDNQEKIIKSINLNAIPMVMVLSSDGTVRWQGNPLQPAFRQIVEMTIAQDPGVAARRKAEAEQKRKDDEAAKAAAASK